METPFKNVNLPTFSNRPLDTLLIRKMEDIHDFKPQMLELIIERDKNVKDSDKNHEIEHFFIDF